MTALAGVERLAPDAIVTASPEPPPTASRSKIGLQAGTRWPLDEMLASMMMVSANDAAYAVGRNRRRRQPHELRDRRRTQTARRLGMRTARSATRPASPTRRRTRAARCQRVRPRDRDAQRADRPRDREVGRHARRTTSPTRRRAALAHQPQQVPARRGLRLRGRQRVQDRLHRHGRSTRSSRPRSATAASASR